MALRHGESPIGSKKQEKGKGAGGQKGREEHRERTGQKGRVAVFMQNESTQ